MEELLGAFAYNWWVDIMSVLYVCEQGCIIRKSGKRILVSRERKVLQDIPVAKLERVWLYGNIQLSSQAAALLLDSGVDVVFLSYGGRMRGHLTGMMSKNIFLRLAQYERWQDREFKKNFAVNIVRGKIQNMRVMLLRYQRNHPEVDFEVTLAGLNQGLQSLEEGIRDNSQLLGIEGHCSHLYFRDLARMLRQDLGFTGRKRRPPTDPVNSLLSLTYTMLSNELACILEASSFDPYLGFYHGLRYGRSSLALDLVEEFRQPLADSHVLSLINLYIFGPDDFRPGPNGAIYLTDDGFRKFFEQYEKKVNLTNKGEKASWRDLIIEQVKRLENCIMNDAPYIPYLGK